MYLEVKRKAAKYTFKLDTIGAWKGDQLYDHFSVWNALSKIS